jgi:hypothetical protein
MLSDSPSFLASILLSVTHRPPLPIAELQCSKERERRRRPFSSAAKKKKKKAFFFLAL